MFIESRELVMRHRIPVSKTAKFWKGLERGKVYKTACRECGREYYPPKADCFCGGEVEWVEIDGRGVVEAFTTVYTIPSGFERSRPYTIAIARFGKVRVMGWADDVSVGDEVTIRTGQDENGVWKVYFEVV
ncbi:Zn-ribbon domain-containing OB-fold protein [Archaeoglobus neptunius]|uniref:Zn-ribbon domain-containing OB-fold protein n=1 Tax=Archaeoglobus neptunius TaxID=2798580 RepID=UPI001926AEA6|nr:Zn-ribbon domain-containing OB-fold protein [Archaeoglobus neptunius]